MLDAFVRRQQAEGEEHGFPFHVELVLEKIGVDERHVDDSVRDEVDFSRSNAIDAFQQMPAAIRHDDEPV